MGPQRWIGASISLLELADWSNSHLCSSGSTGLCFSSVHVRNQIHPCHGCLEGRMNEKEDERQVEEAEDEELCFCPCTLVNIIQG